MAAVVRRFSRRLGPAFEARGSKTNKGSFKDDSFVSFKPLSVHFLIDFADQVEDGVLAKDVELCIFPKETVLGKEVIAPNTTCLLKKKLSKKQYLIVFHNGQETIVDPKLLKLKERRNWTVEDVCCYVVKPEVIQEEVQSYSSAIEAKFPQVVSKEYTGSYVVYPRSCRFTQLINGLATHFKNQNLTKNFVYLDIFGIAYGSEHPEELTSTFLEKELPVAMKKFNSVLVYLPDWKDSITLKRSWCLYELHLAASCKKKLHIVCQEKKKEDPFLNDFEDVMEAVSFVDFDESGCESLPEYGLLCDRVDKLPQDWASKVVNELRHSILEILEEKSCAIRRETGKRSDADTLKLSQLLQNSSRVLVGLGKSAKSISKLQEAVILLKRVNGSDDEAVKALEVRIKTLEQWQTAKKKNTSFLRKKIITKNKRASMSSQGTLLQTDASSVDESSLSSGDSAALPKRATELHDKGSLLAEQGQKTLAKETFEKALKAFRAENESGRDHILMASTMVNIGIICDIEGKYGEAIENFECALILQEERLGSIHIDVASTHLKIGRSLLQQDKLDKSLEILASALSICKQQPGDVGDKVKKEVMLEIGSVFLRQGRIDEAMELFEEVSSRCPESHNGIEALKRIASVYKAQGEYERAVEQLRQVLEKTETIFGKKDVKVADIKNNLAVILDCHLEKSGEAFRYYEESLNSYMELLGPDSIKVADSYYNIAAMLFSQHKYAQARTGFERAMDIYARTNHENLGNTMLSIALCLEKEGQIEEGFIMAKDTLKFYESTFGKDDDEVRRVRKKVGKLIKRRNKSLVGK